MSKRRKAHKIGAHKVEPGSSVQVDLPVGRLPTGTMMVLRLQVLHGAQPGPVLWLSAALHGDELNGIPIIHDAVARLDPRELAGTVIAAPVVNVFGLNFESRYLPDRRDLNRSFPGAPRGSLAAQIAHIFLTNVVADSDVGIDLHTGSDGRANVPQVRCDLTDARGERLAHAFAPDVILEGRPPAGSLRDAAGKRGVTVLNYECGEARRFDERGIGVGVGGVLRVMKALEMIGAAPASAAEPWVCRSSSWLRARRSGFCRLQTALGDRIEEGERLGEITGLLDSSPRSEIRARRSGVVIGRTFDVQVYRGEALLHVGSPT